MIVYMTKKTIYALRATLFLYERRVESFIKIKYIAREAGCPLRFMEIILVALRDAGILQSRRGARGGYRFNKELKHPYIKDIISVTQKPTSAEGNDAVSKFHAFLNKDVNFSLESPLSRLSSWVRNS